MLWFVWNHLKIFKIFILDRQYLIPYGIHYSKHVIEGDLMYIWLGVIWIVGMVGYIVLNQTDKYNNKHYYDVKHQIKKYKNIRDDVNGVKKQSTK